VIRLADLTPMVSFADISARFAPMVARHLAGAGG